MLSRRMQDQPLCSMEQDNVPSSGLSIYPYLIHFIFVALEARTNGLRCPRSERVFDEIENQLVLRHKSLYVWPMNTIIWYRSIQR